jgi:hypothetical protein
MDCSDERTHTITHRGRVASTLCENSPMIVPIFDSAGFADLDSRTRVTPMRQEAPHGKTKESHLA